MKIIEINCNVRVTVPDKKCSVIITRFQAVITLIVIEIILIVMTKMRFFFLCVCYFPIKLFVTQLYSSRIQGKILGTVLVFRSVILFFSRIKG